MRIALLVVATGTLGLVGGACTRSPGETPAAARTVTPLDATSAGRIAGTIRFVGTPPPPQIVDTSADPACSPRDRGDLVIREVAAAEGRLADVFVYVKEGLEDRVFAVPTEPVVIDQRGCLFVPSVAGAQTGQPIELRNSDPTLHNVHGAPARSRGWNFGLPVPGAHRQVVIAAPEVMVPIACNVHPWMRVDVGVLDHPYYAVTGPDGRYALSNVPAGTYTVAAWHRKLGTRERAVTLGAGGSLTVDFSYEQ